MPTNPRRMDLRRITQAGVAHKIAMTEADQWLNVVADELLDAGPLANVKLAAQLSGFARTTLTRRMVKRSALRAAARDALATDAATRDAMEVRR